MHPFVKARFHKKISHSKLSAEEGVTRRGCGGLASIKFELICQKQRQLFGLLCNE